MLRAPGRINMVNTLAKQWGSQPRPRLPSKRGLAQAAPTTAAPQLRQAATGTSHEFVQIEIDLAGVGPTTLHTFHDDGSGNTLFILEEIRTKMTNANSNKSKRVCNPHNGDAIVVGGVTKATAQQLRVLKEHGCTSATAPHCNLLNFQAVGRYLSLCGATPTHTSSLQQSLVAASKCWAAPPSPSWVAAAEAGHTSGAAQGTTTVAHTASKPKHKRGKDYVQYGLKDADINTGLQAEFQGFTEFWLSSINLERKGNDKQMSQGSIGGRMRSTIRVFLGYLLRHHDPPIEPTLGSFMEPSLIKAWFDFLIARQAANGQEVKHDTLKAHLECAICVCKYLARYNSTHWAYKDVPAIEKYRDLTRGVRAQRKTEYCKDKDNDPKWVPFNDILDAYLALEAEIEGGGADLPNFKESQLWAKKYQQWLLVSIWVHLPPQRSEILRSIQLIKGSKPTAENRLFFDNKKGVWCLWSGKFKTVGVGQEFNNTCPLPEDLNAKINTYVSKALPIRLQHPVGAARRGLGKPNGCGGAALCMPSEPHLIVNEDGRPFEQSAFSAYVRRMWKQLCGKEMPAKMVRNVVVTEMFDGGAPEAVRDSMAAGMQHTKQTQQQVYRRSNQSTKVQPASNWMQERLSETRKRALAVSNGGVASSEPEAIPRPPKKRVKFANLHLALVC